MEEGEGYKFIALVEIVEKGYRFWIEMLLFDCFFVDL